MKIKHVNAFNIDYGSIFGEKMKWKFLVSEICKMINKSNVRCNGYLFYFKLLLGYWRWRKTTFIQTQIKFNTYSLLFSLLFIFHSTMQHSLKYTLSDQPCWNRILFYFCYIDKLIFILEIYIVSIVEIKGGLRQPFHVL